MTVKRMHFFSSGWLVYLGCPKKLGNGGLKNKSPEKVPAKPGRNASQMRCRNMFRTLPAVFFGCLSVGGAVNSPQRLMNAESPSTTKIQNNSGTSRRRLGHACRQDHAQLVYSPGQGPGRGLWWRHLLGHYLEAM